MPDARFVEWIPETVHDDGYYRVGPVCIYPDERKMSGKIRLGCHLANAVILMPSTRFPPIAKRSKKFAPTRSWITVAVLC